MTDLMARAIALKEIVSRIGSDGTGLSEAETRLLMINNILELVLGWPQAQFHPEDYGGVTADEARKTWLDYHLGTPDRPRLVVEAKRSGLTFTLGATRKSRVVPLRQLLENHGKELKAAIGQAQSYCKQVGTLGFVVTNGHQWIASQLLIPGLPEAKIQGVVFYDLEDVLQNLREFVDLLSPQGLADQTLVSRVGAPATQTPTFAKTLNDFLYAGTPTSKNYLIGPIRLLMRECFGDLTAPDQADILAECYVPTDASDETLRLLESFAGSNLPNCLPLSAEKLRRDNQGTSSFADQVTAGSAVLIVGRAGSGKSTFLAMTRLRLAALKKSHNLLLYIDLLARTETHARTFDHDRLIDEVCRDLLVEVQSAYSQYDPFRRDTLEAICAGEIDRLKARQREGNRDGPDFDAKVDELLEKHVAEPKWHLKAFLGYLAKQGVPVTVLLDNVDRGTPEFEMVTSKLADHLVANTSATVATCLRDTTYQAGKTGFLDVRRQTVMTISPPPFTEVARRRFEATRKKLSTDSKFRRKLIVSLSGTPLESVKDFAEIIADLVLGGDGQLRDCITSLAATNIRKALSLLEDFSVSPHTDLNKLFSQYQNRSQGRPNWGPSLDVFLRSVMRGDAQRYSERHSAIVNLLQATAHHVGSHFTAIRILQLLDWHSRKSRDQIDARVDDVIGRLGGIGHRSGDALATLNHLGRHGLVQSLSKPEPDWTTNDTVRIGFAGKYYLGVLLLNREYLNNVVDDTVIYDETTLRGLESTHNDRGLSWAERNDGKALQFLGYLARRERQELPSSKGGSIPEWLSVIAEEIGVRRFGASFRGELKRRRMQ